MNNLKFDYGKKYHYLLKYIIMSIPVLLLVLSFLFPKKEITNNYSVDSTTQVNYKYQTNEVNSFDDLIIGNMYKINNEYYSSGYSFYTDYFIVYNYSNTSVDIAYLDLTQCTTSSNSFNFINPISIGFNSSLIYVCSYLGNINALDYNFFTICPTEYLLIEDTTITNTINDNSSVLSVDEVRVNNVAYLKPLNDFYKLSFNNWYDNLLSSMNLTIDNDTTYYLYHIPLYIIFVYIFDIIVDLFGMIFRLGHKLISKVGGDY